jgi:peroxiredoxin
MKTKNTILVAIALLIFTSVGVLYYKMNDGMNSVSGSRCYNPNANLYGYKLGDKVHDFRLPSTSGRTVSMAGYPDAKGFIVVFTCNSCLYSQAYEKRINRLDSIYTHNGWPVIAINPNNPALSPADAFDKMQERAKEKKYQFPYLYDAGQVTAEDFGAKHTPMVYVVKKDKSGDYLLKYAGTMDDNTWDDEDVTANYVSKAIAALAMNRDPEISYTKAIGCTIKR